MTAPGERLGRLYAELIDEIESILERMPAVPYGAEPSDVKRSRTAAGSRGRGAHGSRMVTIIVVAVALFVSLGGLYWWTRVKSASNQEAIVVAKAAPIAAPAPARIATLTAKPSEFDFGEIRKGGRYIQTFTLFNDGDEPLDISVDRSRCHCLWFQHDDQIPPRGSIPLVVALDTSQLEPDRVDETIHVRAKAAKLHAEIHIAARVVAAAARPQ